ncbi:hypothetical protein KAJ87_03725 [Candidatus Pacearchaeota archaeon]|nr:hypothetical protein [Candidatus Pacearchaeota archaeon]
MKKESRENTMNLGTLTINACNVLDTMMKHYNLILGQEDANATPSTPQHTMRNLYKNVVRAYDCFNQSLKDRFPKKIVNLAFGKIEAYSQKALE